jgi:DNA polymerase-1
MKLISFDIETWGLKEGYALQPWRAKTDEGGIICVKRFPETYLGNDVIHCGWNLKFDTAWFFATRIACSIPPRFLDGMLLLKRLFQDLPTYALKPTLELFQDKIDFFCCGQAYLVGYQNHIEFKTGSVTEVYTPRELELLQLYCQRDTAYTYALVKYLISLADRNTLLQAIRESTVSVLFADAWQRGLPIDRAEVAKQSAEISSKIQKCNDVLLKVGLTDKILNSPKQLREFLCSTWNIRLTKLTPKGDYSVDSSVLKNLAWSTEGTVRKALQIMIKRKELQTEHDKFIVAAEECLKESDVIHPDPIMNSTYTGRMTYSVHQTIKTTKVLKNGKTRTSNTKIALGLPIHQMKRGNLRKMFIAPKGYKLVELDFAGQEMRLMATIAPEPTMIKLFNSDSDLHAYTASSIYGYTFEEFEKLKGTDEYKVMRQLGKLTNFGLQYRASAKRLYMEWHDKYGLTDKTIADAERARNVYLDLYTGISTYWRETIAFARNNNYVENMAGRKHYLTKWTGDDEWKSQQSAVNYPIQSTGAEQKILALFELRKLMNKEGIQLAWDLHDGMYFFIPESVMMSDVILEMIDIASNLNYEKAWGWETKVKFPVEAKIGDNWGELKSFA